MKRSTRILMKLLTYLGFTVSMFSCMKYGVPQAELNLSGIVTDSEGNPIEGIKVEIPNDMYFENICINTKPNGSYSIEDMTVENPGSLECIIFTDTDGPENGGEFLPDTVHQTEMNFESLKSGNYKLELNVSLNKKP